MNLINSVINIVVLPFVFIGDLVISLFFFPVAFLKQIASNKSRKKRAKSGTFKLKKTKKGISLSLTMALFGNRVKRRLSLFINYILILLKKLGSRLRVLLSLPFTIIHAISANNKKIQIKKQIERRKAERYKNGIYKPSIFYKLKYVFVGFLFSFIFLFVPLLAFVFVSELPNPAHLSANYIPKTTKIMDRNGNLLYEIYANQNRTVVKLADVPKTLRDATIAIEDKDFYNHPGFDLRGILRAFVTNVRNEGFQGGSTITQQLIKSAFLTPEPTVIRKVKEVTLAFWAERVYSKDEILELYLNYVPYGGTAWGIQAASEIYFGKSVHDLTLSESAFLAGLPQSPSVYSPFFGNPDLWKKRQKEVLDSMVKQGYVTKREAEQASAQELVFQEPDVPLKAPHFVMYVRNLLVQKYGISEVERGGLQVITSLDLEVQEEAEKIVAEQVEGDASLNVGNGAALVTDPTNGDIIAMVGSKNYFDVNQDGNVNLTTSLRQPGSSIKMVTYALALSEGYTEATILDDTPLTIPGRDGSPSYTPVNYDGTFHGRVPLRTAFANSFNIPPVRIAQKLGPTSIKDFGEQMGISSWKSAQNYGVSITLGGLEVRMTDMATVYGTVANSGTRVSLAPIREVKDSYGVNVFKKTPISIPVLDPGVAFIISDILADNNARAAAFGPSSTLNIPGRRVSVKTGTTDSKRDNWTIGFTPNVVVATWVGNNDNTPMNQALASGITGAAPMWNRIMTYMLDKVGTPSAVTVPSNVIRKFCVGQERYFIQGTESTVNCRGNGPQSPLTPSPRIN